MKKKRHTFPFRISCYAAGFFLLLPVLFSLIFEVSLDLRESCSAEIQREIDRRAKDYRLPPELVSALIWRESRYRPLAVGKRGEIGLMQLMPPGTPGAVEEWARRNGVSVPARKDIFSPALNLEIGCWYLAAAMKRWREYRCGTELALAHYNAGAARVGKWKPEKPDGEFLSRIDDPGTRKYVTDIMGKYRQLLREKRAEKR